MSSETEKPDKGQWGGSCNRTTCQNRDAVYYNRSTRAYYCADCAELLNRVNAVDAQRLYGGPLCIPVPAAPAPEATRETDEQGVSSLEANKRGGEWFSAKYVERLRAALASSEAARREDLEDLEKALQRAEAAEAARATAERERDEAVKEAKRRDEKWMAGIREECAPTEITFDPLAPDVRRHVHTLGSFIRELRARAARAPEPQP